MVLTQQTDEELVLNAQAGAYEAFAELAHRYSPTLYTMALRILRDRHLAEDVVQCSLLKAIEKISDLKEGVAFGGWIRRIAFNLVMAQLRKKKQMPMAAQSDHEADDFAPIQIERVADWRPDVSQIAQSREFRTLLEDRLAQLDDKYRLVFILRDLEQLSVEETAQKLNISVSNVKVRLMRARLMLREALTELFGVEQPLGSLPGAQGLSLDMDHQSKGDAQ
jgi:RNA polymerase sigma-70 factor (ECF subfamily)